MRTPLLSLGLSLLCASQAVADPCVVAKDAYALAKDEGLDVGAFAVLVDRKCVRSTAPTLTPTRRRGPDGVARYVRATDKTFRVAKGATYLPSVPGDVTVVDASGSLLESVINLPSGVRVLRRASDVSQAMPSCRGTGRAAVIASAP